MPLFNDILDMIYPRYCMGCDSLLDSDDVVCFDCMDELPYTDFFKHDNNPIKEIFYGRIIIQHGGSLLFYTKESLTQRLIFNLKYENNHHAGKLIGILMAKELSSTDWINEIDVITPMPMHRKKQRVRGYNQATIIAQSLSDNLNIPMNEEIIIKSIHTETQTHKTREERWQSMQHVFEVKDKNALAGKHILLVDDVITTGASIEACGNKILSIENTKLSIATAAYAL